MNYYICEGNEITSSKYNASSKARNDIEKILDKEGFYKFLVPTKYGVQEKKILKIIQYFQYIKNKYTWDKHLRKLKKGDNVFIQYPLKNTTLGFAKILRKYSKKGINFIAIIHDVNSLRLNSPNRTKKYCKRVVYEDKTILKEFSKIISHNKFMTKKLINLGCKQEKIIELEIFDYLIDIEIKEKERIKDGPIIIAGNLIKEKAGYLKYLKDISNVNFNLYGEGYVPENKEENIFYKGAFLPEELINNLDGSFGLIWDGDVKEVCSGAYGEYLKYNNPHKASLYLTAGIPVITWKEAAIAKFILDNKVGLTIDSLDQIDEKLKKLTDEEYYDMVSNAKRISKELRNGQNLKRTIKYIL